MLSQRNYSCPSAVLSLLTSLSGVHVHEDCRNRSFPGYKFAEVTEEVEEDFVERIDRHRAINYTPDQHRGIYLCIQRGHSSCSTTRQCLSIESAVCVINEPIWKKWKCRRGCCWDFYFVGKFIANRSMCHWQTFLLSIM